MRWNIFIAYSSLRSIFLSFARRRRQHIELFVLYQTRTYENDETDDAVATIKVSIDFNSQLSFWKEWKLYPNTKIPLLASFLS